MKDLKTITQLVRTILEEDKRTRNSDSLLYLRVLEHYAAENGIWLHHLTVPTFLTSMEVYGFPPFESVRRTRQKVQASRPDLAACEEVVDMRFENFKTYRSYALGELE